jgi:hypothetical protein
MAEKLLREKIGWKPGMRVLEVGLPDGLASPFSGVEHTSVRSGEGAPGAGFDLVLGFARDSTVLREIAPVMVGAGGDEAKIWIGYPKLSSKQKTDLTRDTGWEPMLRAGWIVVAIASVDAVWSAVRFRPKERVKSVRYGGKS